MHRGQDKGHKIQEFVYVAAACDNACKLYGEKFPPYTVWNYALGAE